MCSCIEMFYLSLISTRNNENIIRIILYILIILFDF